MIKIIKNNLTLILNIFLGLIILPILFSISFVDIENIFDLNYSNLFAKIYFIYLIIGTIFLLLFRFTKINNKIFREEIFYTIRFIFLISIFLIPSFSVNHTFLIEHIGESNLYLRSYGRIAFLYLALALVISPILNFIKNANIRDNLILSRKVLGLISFVFFLKHGFEYFSVEYIYQTKYNSDTTYIQYVYKNMLVRYDALSGFVAGVLMLVLGLTSNKISVKLFSGKGWKLIQSLVYPTFLLSMIHIAFASRFDNFYIFLIIFVVSIRTIAYFSSNGEKKTGKTTKYICIPCGYIYDENIGDPDGGLESGTKFEDIPDDWYCPVCGVGKSDFEPYYEEENTIFGGYLGEVVSSNMLTEDVLELSLKLDTEISVLKGQYAILTLTDFDGEFSRAYSIVEYKDNIITFGVKLKDTGRGGRFLKSVKKGDIVKIKGIYGDFVLKDTKNPKVFISTGTGLSPMINMISSKLKSKDNHLFFGVQKEKDLFFLDKINKAKNIENHIYLSREEVKEYNFGRIDLTKFEFAKNTEFYICGSLGFVTGTYEYLEKAGYKNIYSEKF